MLAQDSGRIVWQATGFGKLQSGDELFAGGMPPPRPRSRPRPRNPPKKTEDEDENEEEEENQSG